MKKLFKILLISFLFISCEKTGVKNISLFNTWESQDKKEQLKISNNLIEIGVHTYSLEASNDKLLIKYLKPNKVLVDPIIVYYYIEKNKLFLTFPNDYIINFKKGLNIYTYVNTKKGKN